MKAWKVWAVLPILWLVGCQKPSSTESARNEPVEVTDQRPTPTPAPSSFSCSTGIQDGFSCLKKACEFAGGTFDQRIQQCDCKAGERFFGWSNPTCDRDRHSVSKNSVAAQFTDPRYAQDNQIDWLEQESEVRRQSLLVLAERWHQPSFREQKRWTLSPLPSQILTNRFETQLFFNPIKISPDQTPSGSPSMSGLYPEFSYYLNTDHLVDILQSKDVAVSVKLAASIPNVALAQKVADALVGSKGDVTVQSSSGLGCLGSCIVNRDISIGNGYRVRESTAWAGGSPYRRFTNVYINRDDSPSLTFIQSPMGRIVMMISFTTKSESAHYARTASAYSIEGKQLIEYAFEIPAEDFAAQSGRTDFPTAIMCESNLVARDLKTNGLAQFIAQGPLQSRTPQFGKSYWGWLRAISVRDYFSGFQSISAWGVFDYGDTFAPIVREASESHGSEVLREMVGTDADAKIIPMGVSECLSQSILRDRGVAKMIPKVLNLSSGFPMSKEACEAASPTLTATPFLWVMAAGNSSLRTVEAVSFICPQNLVPRDHSLIVGALKDGAVAAYSNANADYTDIFADGSTVGGSGTSFASPRVARVASHIAVRWPAFTVAQIRMIVMMSADISKEMPARSRGVLDEAAAYRLAALVDGNLDFASAITKIYEGSTRSKKLDVLRLLTD